MITSRQIHPHTRNPTDTGQPRQTTLGLAMVLAGLFPATAVHADDGVVISGSDAFDLTITGRINRALMVADDGQDTTLLNVDNNNGSSRIAFIADSSNDGPLQAGAAYEAEFRINNSASIRQDETDENDTEDFRARRAEIFLAHDDLGKLWLGQGATATDDITQQDLSGTMNAGYSFVSLIGGGIAFRDSATGRLIDSGDGQLTDDFSDALNLADVTDSLDGFGRNTRIRYDTPEFGGLQFRTSVINDGGVDAAAFYSSEIGGWRVIGAVGYGNTSQVDLSSQYDDQVSGSISVRSEGGLNLSLATGTAKAIDNDRDDLEFFYGKLGYRSSLFPSVGETAVSVDWGQTRNEDRNDDTADVVGIQIAQEIDVVDIEIYTLVRNASLDRQGSDFDDILIGMIGARLDF
ncbi:hypothetical protein [Marinobacter sp.]|uniref:hypothetical protein n=1 Tax=Marinobacter sp. TaxID=50741 RepID=UPI002B4A8668|nr:hypothetical protein [Marinobacter sp.]HKK54821.1 hypothetical protein [Marinobacter sp.]